MDYPSREELLRRHARKKANYWLTFFAVVAAIVILFSFFDGDRGDSVKEKPKSVAEKRIESQFNPWDGSHVKLTKMIKDGMHDPDSYEHIETKYWEIGDGALVVVTEFRGTNALGAKVKQSIKAQVDSFGNVTKVFE